MRLSSWVGVIALVGAIGCGDDGTGSGAGGAAQGGGAEGGAAAGGAAAGGAAEGGAAQGGGSSSADVSTSATGGAGQGGGSMAQAGTLHVMVEYAGIKTGTLRTFVVTEFPPNNPPLGTDAQPMATFPALAMFEVEAGKDLYVATYLDVGDDNPMGPGPGDLLAATMAPVQAVADDTTHVPLTIPDAI
jgi:hypothetical protein